MSLRLVCFAALACAGLILPAASKKVKGNGWSYKMKGKVGKWVTRDDKFARNWTPKYEYRLLSNADMARHGISYNNGKYANQPAERSGKANMHDAVEMCMWMNAQVVSIHNEDEHKFVIKMLEGNKKGFWVGAVQVEEGEFRNLDGTDFDYSNFAAKEPSYKSSAAVEERCLFSGANKGNPSLYHDVDCHKDRINKKKVVCKREVIGHHLASDALLSKDDFLGPKDDFNKDNFLSKDDFLGPKDDFNKDNFSDLSDLDFPVACNNQDDCHQPTEYCFSTDFWDYDGVVKDSFQINMPEDAAGYCDVCEACYYFMDALTDDGACPSTCDAHKIEEWSQFGCRWFDEYLGDYPWCPESPPSTPAPFDCIFYNGANCYEEYISPGPVSGAKSKTIKPKLNTGDAQLCAEECDANVQCTHFAYKSTSGKCTLYLGHPTAHKKKGGDSVLFMRNDNYPGFDPERKRRGE